MDRFSDRYGGRFVVFHKPSFVAYRKGSFFGAAYPVFFRVPADDYPWTIARGNTRRKPGPEYRLPRLAFSQTLLRRPQRSSIGHKTGV